jgi:hypothetical protein
MISLNRLSTVLRADAAFCLLCGLPGIVAPAWLAGFLLPSTPTLLGLPMRDVMLEIGILLALYAVILFLVSRRPSRALVAAFTLADAGWVLGTLLLLALGGFSAWGAAALLVVAACTALLGWLKLRLLRGEAGTVAAA